MDAFIQCLQGNKYADDHKTFVESTDANYATLKAYNNTDFSVKSNWSNQTGGQIYDYVDNDIKGAKQLNRALIQNANDLRQRKSRLVTFSTLFQRNTRQLLRAKNMLR